MELKVLQQDGNDSGRTVTLDPAVFAVEPNNHAMWLDVRRTQANARQGTHKAKERSETAGSRRKLYRQKGTGHARAGDAKSPIRKTGGTIFGPKPHAYSLKVNRKTQRLARRSALTYKAQDERIQVVEDFSMEAPSTNALRDLLSALELSDAKVLLLTGQTETAMYRSARNLSKVRVQVATDVSTFDVLNADYVVIQEAAVEALTTQLSKGLAKNGSAPEVQQEDAPAAPAEVAPEAAEATAADEGDSEADA